MTTLEFPQATDWGHVPPCGECKKPLNVVVEFGHGGVLCADCAGLVFGWTVVKQGDPADQTAVDNWESWKAADGKQGAKE